MLLGMREADDGALTSSYNVACLHVITWWDGLFCGIMMKPLAVSGYSLCTSGVTDAQCED